MHVLSFRIGTIPKEGPLPNKCDVKLSSVKGLSPIKYLPFCLPVPGSVSCAINCPQPS